jgi:hypothetical protein
MADNEKVAYELELDLPGHPKGEGVQIPGLGTFENGSVYEVTEEEAQSYRVYHTRQVQQTDEHGNVLGADTELGPTLLQAFRKYEGITVTVAKGNPPEEDEEEEELDTEEDELDGDNGDINVNPEGGEL